MDSAARDAWRLTHAATNISVCGLFIAIYIAILHVMRTDADMLKSSCYRLMFHLGMFDLQQLLAIFLSGVMLLAEIDNFTLNKFLGALVSSSFFAFCAMLLLIAVNRWLVITRSSHANTAFSHTAVKVYACLAWSLVPLWIVLGQAGVLVFYYRTNLFFWGWSQESAPSQMMAAAALPFILTTVVGAALVYLALFIYTHKQHQEHSAVGNQQQQRRREMVVALQAILMTGSTGLSTLMFQSFVTFELLPKGFANTYVLHLTRLMRHCANPIILLTLNSKMRQALKQLVRKEDNKVHSTKTTAVAQR